MSGYRAEQECREAESINQLLEETTDSWSRSQAGQWNLILDISNVGSVRTPCERLKHESCKLYG